MGAGGKGKGKGKTAAAGGRTEEEEAAAAVVASKGSGKGHGMSPAPSEVVAPIGGGGKNAVPAPLARDEAASLALEAAELEAALQLSSADRGAPTPSPRQDSPINPHMNSRLLLFLRLKSPF